MENASKALIIAAEVLLGVMLISFGVYVFNNFGNYSTETTQKIVDTQIAEFNEQFLKFYGQTTYEDGTRGSIKCTIHDIASLANLAQKNNIEYELTGEKGYSDNTFYIQIDLGRKRNLEKYTNSKLTELIKENDLVNDKVKYYYISQEPNISSRTKRVNHVIFKEL